MHEKVKKERIKENKVKEFKKSTSSLAQWKLAMVENKIPLLRR